MIDLLKITFPFVKVVLTFVGFMLGLGWGAYHSVQSIAQAEGQVIETRVIAVRNADFQHFDGRFNKIDEKLDEIKTLTRKNK